MGNVSEAASDHGTLLTTDQVTTEHYLLLATGQAQVHGKSQMYHRWLAGGPRWPQVNNYTVDPGQVQHSSTGW